MKRALLFLLVLIASPALARPIVSDLSSHEITIHTSFEGADLILFGARNNAGDIVVVVRGPARDAVIRRKEPVAGMWINKTTERFEAIPGFYALASSRPYEEIPKSVYFKALGIGYEEALAPPLLFSYLPPTKQEAEERATFAEALLRDLRAHRLYGNDAGEVTFVGETLFRAAIPFPDNMPRGIYTAEVYLFSNGMLVGAESIPINVHKSGFDAFVYDLSQHHPLSYGLIAVGLALFGGWFASYLFSRR